MPKGFAGKWLPRLFRSADVISVVAVFIYLLSASWLRWLDPLTDFPKDLYIAWRISEGDLLYEKVTNWYGPLPHLIEAAGFRLFGVGLDTIVWMNIALTVGVLFLLRGILGAVGNRFTVWLSSIVFVVVFAFNHCTFAPNANFITPYTASTTYGFAGLLLLLWGLLRHLKQDRPIWLGVAGLGLAITYLDKPEPLLAAMGAVALYFAAQAVRIARFDPQKNSPADWRGMRGWLWSATSWVAGGFFSLWLPVFLFFLVEGGPGYAFLATDYVPHTLLDQSIRDTVRHSIYHLHVMGFDQPWKNFLTQLTRGGVLAFVCAILAATAWWWTCSRRFGLIWWICLAGVAVVVAAATGVEVGLDYRLVVFWLSVGWAVVFPVILAAGALAIWSLWSAWRNRADFSHVLSLAVIGVAGSLMLSRMILNVTLYDTGFILAPLAVFFLIQLVMVELARPGPGSQRANWLLPVAFSLLVLFGVKTLGGNSLLEYRLKTYAVGSGRDHFYAFPSKISITGPLLQAMIQNFKEHAPNARTLVGFPEAIAVNYHLRIPSTLAELEFHPDALGYAGPQHVLQELQAHPPDVIFLHFRRMDQFTARYFGDTVASGRDIFAWINDHYQHVASAGDANNNTITGHTLDLYLPKASTKLVAPNNSLGLP